MSDETKPESVYELGLKALDEIDSNENDSSQHITTAQYYAIEDALTAGDAAEKRAYDWEQNALVYAKHADEWGERAEAAEARVKVLEDAGRQLTESYLHELERVQRMSAEVADAIALMKPARPEDGLLPAVRDVMQRLALAEAALSKE
jgi:hypothetical protein